MPNDIHCEAAFSPCQYPDCACKPAIDPPGPHNVDMGQMHSESKLQPPVEHCAHCKGFGFVVRKDLAP